MTTTPRLTPAHEAFLADTIKRNQSLFGGWSMDGTDVVDPAPAAGEEAPAEDAGEVTPAAQATTTETVEVAAGEEQEIPADADPAEVARIAKANKEAQRYRTERNDLQTKLDALLSVLNPEAAGDKPKTLEEVTAAAEQARKEAQEARTEAAVTRAAVKHGADLDRLTDSRKFMASIADLTEAADIEAAVQTALEADGSLKAARAAAASTTDGPGGTPPAPTGVLAELEAIRNRRG